MENIMSWENIKDYQFSSSRYFKRDEIEKQELSLYMIDEKTLDSLFLNGNFKTLSRREFVKSFALPLLDCEYIFCDDMDEVWAFTAQFMENIAPAYMLNQEIQIENVGNSIRELIQCYDEYMNETNDNYHLYLKVKDFLLKLPTSKEENISIKSEYLDQYTKYYPDALRCLLSILSSIFNIGIPQSEISERELLIEKKRGYQKNIRSYDENRFDKLLASFYKEYKFAKQEPTKVLADCSNLTIKADGFNNFTLHIRDVCINNTYFHLSPYLYDCSTRTIIFENCIINQENGVWLYYKSFIFKNCIFNTDVNYPNSPIDSPRMKNFFVTFTQINFERCEFNGNCNLDNFQKGTYTHLILKNCTFSASSNFHLSNIAKLDVLLDNVIFGGKVFFDNVYFWYGQWNNILFLNEFRNKSITFSSEIKFNQITFGSIVVKTSGQSIKTFAQTLRNNGYIDYATDLEQFYLHELGNSNSKNEIDIAIKSDWVNIKQAASILGLSYNTLLTMRKEDKATGIIRIPYVGEGKSTKYYYPLLIAYKSGDISLVNKLAKEMERK